MPDGCRAPPAGSHGLPVMIYSSGAPVKPLAAPRGRPFTDIQAKATSAPRPSTGEGLVAGPRSILCGFAPVVHRRPYPASARQAATSSLAITLSNAIAGPCGRLCPCSHLRRVHTEIPNVAADSACDMPIAWRPAAHVRGLRGGRLTPALIARFCRMCATGAGSNGHAPVSVPLSSRSLNFCICRGGDPSLCYRGL
jgi:hypothetical protein